VFYPHKHIAIPRRTVGMKEKCSAGRRKKSAKTFRNEISKKEEGEKEEEKVRDVKKEQSLSFLHLKIATIFIITGHGGGWRGGEGKAIWLWDWI